MNKFQGAFLTVNSDESTMSRNSGIFWAMLECSLLVGNTFAYFQFKDDEDISKEERNLFVGILLACGLAGERINFMVFC